MTIQKQTDYGASFLTGGLIAVGLLASTVFATWSIEDAWAPKTPIINRISVNMPEHAVVTTPDTLRELQQERDDCRNDNPDWAKKHHFGESMNIFGGLIYYNNSPEKP
jgi:hypothetical protein